MKDWQQLTSKSQSEALINEFKGNLLEYLLAGNLAREFQLEGDFFSGLDEQYRQKLSLYEEELRRFDPHLVIKLPEFAAKLGQKLNEILPKNAAAIELIGKQSGQNLEQYKEADLLIKYDAGISPISLKFSQLGSLINTKSGGIRTFLSTYFPGEWSEKGQQGLNELLDQSFDQMARELYQLHELEYQKGFDEQWTDSGLSELPGQLDKESKVIVQQHYHRMIAEIYRFIREFHQKDPQAFSHCLLPLVGIGRDDLIQLKCFHTSTKTDRYLLAGIKLDDARSWKAAIEKLVFKKLDMKVSFFEIGLGQYSLQIRVKPMNKFTVPGLKINCSIKESKN